MTEKNDFATYINNILEQLPAFIARAKLLAILNKNIKETMPHVGEITFANDHGFKITQEAIEIPINFVLRVSLKEILK